MASKPPAYDGPQRKELHFFPAVHQLIWLVDGEPLIVARAWGGVDPTLGAVSIC